MKITTIILRSVRTWFSVKSGFKPVHTNVQVAKRVSGGGNGLGVVG